MLRGVITLGGGGLATKEDLLFLGPGNPHGFTIVFDALFIYLVFLSRSFYTGHLVVLGAIRILRLYIATIELADIDCSRDEMP